MTSTQGATPPRPKPTVDIRRSATREHHHSGDGILGRFSFPFTGNFDLTAYAHGALLVHNDDLIDPRSGVDPHRHADMEIVTWVVAGSVVHEDTAGHRAVLHRGMVQRMSAGTGLLHSELNPSTAEVARVVQMWLPPDAKGATPAYAERDLNDALADGTVVTALSGRSAEAPGLGIGNRFVSLDVVRPRPGQAVEIAGAPFHHVFVTQGSVRLELEGSSQTLGDGDAARLTSASAFRLEGGAAESEVLIWRMHAHF